MKVKKINLAIILSLISLILLAAIRLDSKKVSTTVDAPKADCSFVVLGDIHDNISGFQNAIDDFYKINPSIDALVLNGDTVDQGKDEQYDDIKKVLTKNKNRLPKTIIKNIGNHEFYNYDYNSNSKEDRMNFISKYLAFSETEKVYHDNWINGYHFISLGSDDVENEDFNTTAASLTDEQLSWFKETLKVDYEEGKPIFIFLHQPMTINFFGRSWSGVKQEDELKEILSNYPEAIIFSSHTHKDFADDSIMLDMPFSMVHTGAVGYTLLKDDSSESGMKRENSYNNGLYVEVNGNDVTINGRNIANHSWTFSKNIIHY